MYFSSFGKYLVVVTLSILVCIGCGSADEGIEGTGFDIKGTVAVGAPIANQQLVIRDINGNRRTAITDAQGKYLIRIDDMQAPFLIKVKVNENRSLYSIAYEEGVANVHPLTDIVIRNWYASENRDLNQEYASDNILIDPPLLIEIDAVSNRFKNTLSSAFSDFSLSQDFNIFTSVFDADETGFDRLLDHVSVNIETNIEANVVINQFSIVIIDQTTNMEVTVINSLDLSTDLSKPDVALPTIPDGLAVLSSNTNSLILVWNASSDNTGVAGYNIYRDILY